MKQKSEISLKQSNFEVFSLILTFLSFFNTAIFIQTDDPDIRAVIITMELLLSVIFLAEFLGRLGLAPSRSYYFFKGYGWLDLIGSFPILRLARIFRFYKTIMYFRAIKGRQFVRDFFANRAETAVLSILLAVILLFEFGSIMILRAEALAPEANINTAGDALWWVLVTVATVGYGDLYPVTENGRLIAGLVIVAGVGLFGILSGYLARLFLGNLGREAAADKADTDSVMDTTAAILDEIRQLREEQTQQQQAQEEAANALHARIHALEQLLEQKEKNNQ